MLPFVAVLFLSFLYFQQTICTSSHVYNTDSATLRNDTAAALTAPSIMISGDNDRDDKSIYDIYFNSSRIDYDQFTQQFFDGLDMDHNGVLTQPELDAGMTEARRSGAMPQSWNCTLTNLDADGTDSILHPFISLLLLFYPSSPLSWQAPAQSPWQNLATTFTSSLAI